MAEGELEYKCDFPTRDPAPVLAVYFRETEAQSALQSNKSEFSLITEMT